MISLTMALRFSLSVWSPHSFARPLEASRVGSGFSFASASYAGFPSFTRRAFHVSRADSPMRRSRTAASIAASARTAFSFASASAVALCAFFSFSSSTSSFSLSALADFASSSDDSARARSAAKSPIAWAPAFSAVRTSSSDASSGRPKI